MNFTQTYCCPASSKLPETAIVFIVDGDAATRNVLESVIRVKGWQVTTAASAEEFLARPRETRPCCLLVEQHLPGSSGLELQELLCDRTEMPIIFMSHHADVEATVRAMKAGALEFLTKPFQDEVLLSAVGDAIERSRVALSNLAQIHELQECYELLSRREREVMNGVVNGRLNKQVGGDLGISEITVKAHRGKVMRKMRACSFAELVRMAASLYRSTPADLPDTLVPEPDRGRQVAVMAITAALVENPIAGVPVFSLSRRNQCEALIP